MGGYTHAVQMGIGMMKPNNSYLPKKRREDAKRKSVPPSYIADLFKKLTKDILLSAVSLLIGRLIAAKLYDSFELTVNRIIDWF